MAERCWWKCHRSAYSIDQTVDGGYIAMGYTASFAVVMSLQTGEIDIQ